VARIHPTAIVEAGAELDTDVSVGPYTIVGPKVRVGARTSIGSHTVLEGATEIAAGCRIGSHVVIGSPPQDVKYHDEPTGVAIGEDTLVREFATIHRASIGGSGVTRVGPRCFIMAYAHVAHDCELAEHVIMANQASLAGHVSLGRFVNVGGMTGIHQFVRVGEFAFVGACSGILQDIPPFVKVQGNRAKPFGLNVVGLRRHGFSAEAIAGLKEAYRLVFDAGLNMSQALERLDSLPSFPELRVFVEFIKRSRRGIAQ
jgi:UDP-N-acetylglucosamine acyltransferase